MAEEVITKRLHVSGLTPAITPADLSQKLGSFGAVKALDGFGALDALGRPRPFGYVTLETTKPKLARCMNLLSGVTWKGTKLRIGEAKPDFRERLAKEREAQDGEPPRKRRRLPRGVQGVHAPDMSLVTPENAAQRAGWKVTPLGRLIRPIRMRPERPLPEPVTSIVPAKGKGKEKVKEKKRKRREPPTRARRQTIDPLKYGSEHVKGIFLENVVVEPRRELPQRRFEDNVEESVSDSEDESTSGSEGSEEAMQVEEEPWPVPASSNTPPPKEQPPPPPPVTDSKPPSASTITLPVKTSSPVVLGGPDLAQEKNAALGLLQSLFGDDDKNWGGEESLSDVDMDELSGKGKPVHDREFEDDIEVVPLAASIKEQVDPPSEEEEGGGGEGEGEDEEDEEEVEEELAKPPTPSPSPAAATEAAKPAKLKDLFAPREEEAGFSLLGHLDLDDELVDDLDPAFAPQAAAPVPAAEIAPVSLPSATTQQIRFTLDSTTPLFFPIPEGERIGFRGRMKDPFDVAKDKGWDWRKFCRTETSDEIKHKWEAQKVELTQDWKRRHREAIKSRRRRGGGGDGE